MRYHNFRCKKCSTIGGLLVNGPVKKKIIVDIVMATPCKHSLRSWQIDAGEDITKDRWERIKELDYRNR